tara:strand:- start:78 stop:1478 length:1401 start_codon:yes stop_codon:yes gene_type:complete
MAVRNKEKKGHKETPTAQQEQCSVVAIYYYINHDMSKQENVDKLNTEFKKIYPKITLAWENTFHNQGKEMAGSQYVKGTKNWKYGWWDAKTEKVNSAPFAKAIGGNTTTVMTKIWDNYFDDQTRKLFGGQKDSWNTADMYMVNPSRESEILPWVKELKEEFIGGLCCDPGVFVGTLNTYLTKLIHQRILIPISLKAQTKNTALKITETNMHEWDDTGKINIVSGKFKPNKTPWFFTNIKIKGGELTFGSINGEGGNSAQYWAEFKVGDYETSYLIEQRMQGDGSKAEVKDIKLNNKDKAVRAAAQTGTVPMPDLRHIVKEYTGEGYDDEVPPIGKPINAGYWYDYIDKVASYKRIPIEYGSWNILGTEYPPSLPGNVEGSWIYKAVEIDNDTRNGSTNDFTIKYGASPGGFSGKLRLKLRQFRFLRAIQKANEKKELADFLVHMYYYAAKQNISEGDIHGPFLKIS